MKIRIIIIITIILAIAGFFYFSNKLLTGYIVETNKKTFTMAICNETTPKGNIYCEDYEIICEDNQISEISPTGFSVQHPSNWQDPRGENGSKIICK
jgi:hypothetical protein